ncbi:MAG: cysteine hydrolase [Clostridiales bacterium]|nr:cysteine hydrolase [Clostridiales bacterium]
MKDLLLVVDMQNVYKEGEPWGCPGADKAAANIVKILESKRAEEVIFTIFTAPKKPAGTWREYNREYADINADVWLNALMDEFLPFADRYPVYEKSTYSSCMIPQVMEAVKRADRVIVCGVVAECCILATVEGLIDSGVKVLYLKDAVAGQTEQFEQITEKIVESFSTIHTELSTTEEYIGSGKDK